MPRKFHWASWALMLVFLTSLALAQEGKQDKKKDKDAPDSKEKAADKMIAAGEVSGKIVAWEGSQRYLTLEVPVRYQVLDQGAVNQLANLQNQLIQASRDTDARNRARRVAELQVQILQQQARLYTTKEEKVRLELQAADDMKVRLSQPPTGFDDKGNPKKYTQKELTELKGPDPKLPGYLGELSDVGQDKVATVTLAKKRDTKSTAKGKEKDDDPAAGRRLLITMIVLYPEPPKK